MVWAHDWRGTRADRAVSPRGRNRRIALLTALLPLALAQSGCLLFGMGLNDANRAEREAMTELINELGNAAMAQATQTVPVTAIAPSSFTESLDKIQPVLVEHDEIGERGDPDFTEYERTTYTNGGTTYRGSQPQNENVTLVKTDADGNVIERIVSGDPLDPLGHFHGKEFVEMIFEFETPTPTTPTDTHKRETGGGGGGGGGGGD